MCGVLTKGIGSVVAGNFLEMYFCLKNKSKMGKQANIRFLGRQQLNHECSPVSCYLVSFRNICFNLKTPALRRDLRGSTIKNKYIDTEQEMHRYNFALAFFFVKIFSVIILVYCLLFLV